MIQFRRIVSEITSIENIAVSGQIKISDGYGGYMAENVGARLKAPLTLS